MHQKNILQVTQEVGYIQNIAENEEQKNDFVLQYLKPLLHSGLGKILKGVKSKGFSAMEIIQLLALLPFLGIMTIGSICSSPFAPMVSAKKDVFYRLKNNGYIPWRKLLYSIARRFLKLSVKNDMATSTTGQKPRCLIFDDSDLIKTGTSIEGVSKIWSHVRNGHVLGFKLLTLGFFDGVSFVAIDFSLHREQGQRLLKKFGLKLEELKNQFVKKRSKDQAGHERQSELDEKKTRTVEKMIIRAIKELPFKVDFVLCDSWFFNESLLKLVVKKGLDLVCGVKMGKLTFVYQGKSYSPKALVKVVDRKTKYSKKLKAHYISLIVSYKGVPIRLFFVKYGRQKKWRIIINTNTKMSFIQTMEVYQIRWSIEVFFKEMKQYLGLEKCQSRDFDAHIAHVTIAMILHTALTLKKRVDNHQTMGEIFREIKSDMLEMTIAQRLWKLFVNIIRKLTDLFDCEPKIIFQKLNSSEFKGIGKAILEI